MKQGAITIEHKYFKKLGHVSSEEELKTLGHKVSEGRIVIETKDMKNGNSTLIYATKMGE